MLQNEISQSAMKNHLKLFSKTGAVNIKRTLELTGVSFEQALQIYGKKAFRKKGEPTPLFQAYIRQLATTLEFVAETFEGDLEKTRFWWLTPNPSFGGLSPFDLYSKRRVRLVFDFVLKIRSRLYGSF